MMLPRNVDFKMDGWRFKQALGRHKLDALICMRCGRHILVGDKVHRRLKGYSHGGKKILYYHHGCWEELLL
jgi:hypothetical protein